MENCFVVKTTLSKEDTRALARLQVGKNRIFMLGCALLLVVFTVMLWVQGHEYRVLFTVFAAAAIICTLIMEKVIAALMYRNANRAAGETSYHISDANIFMQCKLQQGSIPYEAFDSLVETKGHFFLYIQKSSALIFPKRDFVQGDVNAFGEFISEKTGKPLKRVGK